MKKLIKTNISIICAICLMFCTMGGFASAEVTTDDANEAVYSTVPIYLNGIKMTDGLFVNETTYIPLRAYFKAIGNQADIAWNEETNTATITDKGLVLAVTVGNHYLTVNDRNLYLANGALVIDGTIYLPIRELAKLYSASVEWDAESSSVSLCSDNTIVIDSATNYYNEQDLYWLSRLINAESGNQPLEGKIAVGDVVLNRVANPTCPDSIYGVIFDSKYGVQFSVTQNGGIYEEPNEESVIAAKICLEGYNLVGDSIYFVNPEVGVSSWFAKTRVFVATIGQHDFYA
ncbi:MAG: cell wall hydrolase [Oscillospiraceae bacterium]|nr:cell wall hydrolase [Oscillospiraceae bacterium]